MDAAIKKMIEEEKTILAAFEASAEKYPDKTAVIFLGTRFTYRRLRDLINRFATACYDLEVRSHDRVLIYLPNCPQWLIAYLGLQKIGAVPVPVSPIYTPFELTFLLNHSGSRTLLCADANFGYVREVLPKAETQRVVVTRIADLLPAWKWVFGKLFDKLTEGSVSRDAHVLFFNRLMRKSRTTDLRPWLWGDALRGSSEHSSPHSHAGRSVVRGKYPPMPPGFDLDPETHLAHILYTGGTTGFPKGVPHTHLELLSGIAGIREVYRRCVKEAENTLIMPLPLFHMFTQDMIFALGLHLGNTVVILPKPKTDAILASIQEYRGTLLAGVPSLYRQILENDRLEFYDLSSLRYCWSAGDTLPVEVSARWKEKFTIPIYQVYGSTETVCISVSSPEGEPCSTEAHERLPQSAGRPIPTRLTRVVDPETLEPVAPGSTGELLVSSDYSYAAGGYLDNPKETGESYVKIDGRTWCRTGDYVRITGGGEIEFIDRRADLIKHKGYRVSASRVESVLQDHPAVVAACVVGTPDRFAGEKIKAFVILKEDVRGVTAYDLIRHCRERLLLYEVPDYIEFRDMLPKSKVGKLLRREIRDEERRRISSD